MELSDVEARFGRFEEAKSLIERTRQFGPTLRGWQFHLGEIYMLDGNPELAISTLNEALKMHPTEGRNGGDQRQFLHDLDSECMIDALSATLNFWACYDAWI